MYSDATVYMVFSFLGIGFAFFVLLFAFLGTHELMKRLRTNLYRYPLLLSGVFICLIIQLICLSGEITRCKDIVIMYSLIFSTFFILYVFMESIRKYDEQEKILESVIILGIMQVAIAMVVANEGVGIMSKIVANSMAIVFPALASYELTKIRRSEPGENNSQAEENNNDDK